MYTWLQLVVLRAFYTTDGEELAARARAAQAAHAKPSTAVMSTERLELPVKPAKFAAKRFAAPQVSYLCRFRAEPSARPRAEKKSPHTTRTSKKSV